MTKRLSHEHDDAGGNCRFSDFGPTQPFRLNSACLAVGFPSEGGVLHLQVESPSISLVSKGFLGSREWLNGLAGMNRRKFT